MNATAPKTSGSGWMILDFIPGASAAQLCGKLPIYIHLSALEAGASVYLVMTAGFAAAFTMSFLLRTLASKAVQNRTIGNVLGVIVSLGLAMAFVTATVLVEAPSHSKTGVSSQSGAHNSTDDPVTRAVGHAMNTADSSIIVQTIAQDAGGATDDLITTDEVGKWAAYVMKQAQQNAKKTCSESGGDANTCSQITGDETHEVILKDGRKVAIMRINSLVGKTTAGRVLRVGALKGNNLVWVSCIRVGDKPIEPRMSPCAEEITKSLGLTF